MKPSILDSTNSKDNIPILDLLPWNCHMYKRTLVPATQARCREVIGIVALVRILCTLPPHIP